jgi:ribosomal protein S18 acetylase RimI-like enzyme
MRIRPYQPPDAPTLYDICLRTGDPTGGDSTGRYADPRLLGEVYVGPYLALAPELAFVLDASDGTPAGYVLGALDTLAFAARCEVSWWPALRRRYPDPTALPAPDREIATLIHEPPLPPPAVTDPYPSHLHIDLLPVAQGHGHGRALLEHLLAALAAAGSPGVHLGVSPENRNANAFYRRLGFTEVAPFTLARAL